jgi:ATP-dependent Clp protease ATP-binding subunit ClpC
VDEVIVFHELDRDHVKDIADILLRQLRERLLTKGYQFKVTEAARDLLAGEGFDPDYGARPLKRAIQRLVEDPLSEEILHRRFHEGSIVIVDAVLRKIEFREGTKEDVEDEKPVAAISDKASEG